MTSLESSLMAKLQSPLPVFLLLLSLPIANAATYNLLDDFSGKTFFDKWEFYGHYDNLTLGDVNWLDKNGATSKQLAYVNSAGNAVMKVSTDTIVYDNKRDSVRITTQRAYPIGTIWITDVIHMPYGCSVWPAIWTKGQNWPQDGEIDILEGINLNTNNQMALHTQSGCTHVSTTSQTGTSGETDCSKDAGCTVIDKDTASYGDAFNKAGGGVWATQFTADGIYIWFWSRNNIPTSVTSSASSKSAITSQSDWGTPTANYPGGSNCDTSKFFTPQNIVIDITLCGVWGRNPQVYQPQCGNRGPTQGETACYTDNVLGNGTNYQDAYFEIKYVRGYVDSTVQIPSTASGGTSPSSATDAQIPILPFVLAMAAIMFGSITVLL